MNLQYIIDNKSRKVLLLQYINRSSFWETEIIDSAWELLILFNSMKKLIKFLLGERSLNFPSKISFKYQW